MISDKKRPSILDLLNNANNMCVCVCVCVCVYVGKRHDASYTWQFQLPGNDAAGKGLGEEGSIRGA